MPERSESNARAASAPAARSEEADAGLSIPATDLSPLARRLQALTARLSVTPQEEIRAGRGPGPGTEAAVASENQAAAASAGEGRLEAFVAALQQESQARPAAAPPAEETVPDRDEQEAALQQDLQTIASGMLSDARTETRQNLREAARNAEALSGSGSSQEVQSNRQEIRALQADRRAAQQEAQRAEQAIRQLQSRNTRLQAGSNGTSNAGSALDLLAQ